jgi:polyphosphate kinase
MKLDIDNYEMHDNKKIYNHGPFINRELSWIDFNKRVMSCALKKSIPMNERLNFLGITESNLDEFIGVRFANAFHNKETEPYKDILKGIKKFKKYQNETFECIKSEMEKNYNCIFVTPDKLVKKEKELLEETFKSKIFPLLTPLDITEGNIKLESGMSYIGVILKRSPNAYHGDLEKLVVIPLLSSIDPFYQISNKIILLEDIILYYMNDNLFINQTISAKGVFRIIKDASVLLSHDESKFIIDRMEETLNKRSNSNPLFLELREKSDERIEMLLSSIFKVPSDHIYNEKHVINYKVFSKDKIFGKNESYKPFNPFIYENHENYYSLFEAIDNEDILLHHPYDSYETVVKFIQHAAIDPDVITIKQTLYRVSGIDSPIVDALCTAAKYGKFVTVLVEIKARFDENNNIHVIEKLQKAGVNVILGDEFLKTHCKMCIVTKYENGKIKVYSHVATGNYNEKTARIYTDLSYFTSKQKIGKDLLHIFNILSGHSRPDESLDKVYYSPVNLRKKLEKCFDREIIHARKGKKAEVFIKVNSISDIKMVNKIYDAADAGVKVTIICRGVCSLLPRKNLYIKSIVGRFLEHSRIYYFKNGKNSEYYISSADLLTRNLDRRVETLISLKDSNVIDEISWIIEVLKQDQYNSFIEKPDGKWIKANGSFDAHQWMVEYSDIKKQKKSWK